jgi:hypothetical protein
LKQINDDPQKHVFLDSEYSGGIGGMSAVWRHAVSVIVVFYISNEMLDIKYDFS